MTLNPILIAMINAHEDGELHEMQSHDHNALDWSYWATHALKPKAASQLPAAQLGLFSEASASQPPMPLTEIVDPKHVSF
jgi:hypothetical protein